jgi:hypothetical protein
MPSTLADSNPHPGELVGEILKFSLINSSAGITLNDTIFRTC